MKALALSEWSGRAIAANPLVFSAYLVARRLRRRLRASADRRSLQAMPDYLLADIGLSRREVEHRLASRDAHPLGPSYRL